ncbi:RNA methyltransferase [Paracoccus pacificus]|uniref:RNA methyltransferase n=1 Tax=Paracoccus pacificus TaxID=1463598 RepID=A0ABW4R7G5_9RHOB
MPAPMSRHAVPADPQQPVIILVRPQMAANIGAAARAMLNFGLTEMRLVAPRDGWPNPDAVAMASGAAGQVLDRAQVFPTLAEALAGIDFTWATTARGRELTKPVRTPETAMKAARAMVAGGRRVGVIFGPERAGLENADVARASEIVTVPVNPQFASINLAQAVLLIGYEWGRDHLPPEPAPPGRRPPGEIPATGVEIEKLGDHAQERLEAAGFFFPPEKAPGMQLTLRNMWSRLPLTRGDVQLFHGMLRQLARKDRAPGE